MNFVSNLVLVDFGHGLTESEQNLANFANIWPSLVASGRNHASFGCRRPNLVESGNTLAENARTWSNSGELAEFPENAGQTSNHKWPKVCRTRPTLHNFAEIGPNLVEAGQVPDEFPPREAKQTNDFSDANADHAKQVRRRDMRALAGAPSLASVRRLCNLNLCCSPWRRSLLSALLSDTQLPRDPRAAKKALIASTPEKCSAHTLHVTPRCPPWPH